MTLTDTITRLCQLIDSGDDEALPILADALEEAGDPRAAGLRKLILSGRRPLVTGGMDHALYAWERGPGWSFESVCLIEPAIFRRLRSIGAVQYTGASAIYRDRSAAFLALAGALAPTPAARGC